MRELTIGNFRLLSATDLKRGESFRVTSDGEFIFFAIVPPSPEKKIQFEALADQCNKALGFEDKSRKQPALPPKQEPVEVMGLDAVL